MIDEHNVRQMLQRRANAAPQPVVDAAKATRRARRRLFVNGTVALVAVAAITLAGLAGVDEIRGNRVPADQPPPPVTMPVTPPPTPFTDRFDSPLNGLSIGYPSGWRTRAATAPWGGTIAFDAPDVDVIYDPRFRGDLYLAVVSEPIDNKSPEDWVNETLRAMVQSSLGICQGGGGGGRGQGFQGNPSWFQYGEEPHGALCHLVIFATATRGYIIYLHVADERHLQTTYKSHWFWGRDGLLRTVELPEGAPDSSNPSASP
jgi:hypothetical protein